MIALRAPANSSDRGPTIKLGKSIRVYSRASPLTMPTMFAQCRLWGKYIERSRRRMPRSCKLNASRRTCRPARTPWWSMAKSVITFSTINNKFHLTSRRETRLMALIARSKSIRLLRTNPPWRSSRYQTCPLVALEKISMTPRLFRHLNGKCF